MEARLHDRPEPMRGMEHELAKSEILANIFTKTSATKATALKVSAAPDYEQSKGQL